MYLKFVLSVYWCDLIEKKMIFMHYCFCYLADTMDTMKDVLGKWGKKAVEATKKGQDLAGNMWQHCKSLTFTNQYSLFP